MYFHLTIYLVQTYDKARNAVALALSPVVRALVDPEGAMRDIRNLDSVRLISIYPVILVLFLIMRECHFFSFTRYFELIEHLLLSVNFDLVLSPL